MLLSRLIYKRISVFAYEPAIVNKSKCAVSIRTLVLSRVQIKAHSMFYVMIRILL